MVESDNDSIKYCSSQGSRVPKMKIKSQKIKKIKMQKKKKKKKEEEEEEHDDDDDDDDDDDEDKLLRVILQSAQKEKGPFQRLES